MRNFFSTILLMIIVPATLLIVCVSVIKITILTPQFIKKELLARDVYSTVQKQLIAQAQKNNPDTTKTITSSDLEKLITEVVPTTWLQQNTEQTIDRAFFWINSPSHTPLSLPIDMIGPKKQVSTTFNSILEKKAQKVPLKKLSKQLDVFVDQVPDSIDLFNPVLPDISSQSSSEAKITTPLQTEELLKQKMIKAEEIKFQYQQIIHYYIITLIAFFSLLLFYFLLNMKNLRRSIASSGILFFATGFPVCTAAIIGRKIIESKILPQIPQSKEMTPELQKLIISIVGDIEASFFTNVLIVGMMLVLSGVLFLICSRFISKPTS